MNHELEVQIGITPCEETPVDRYVQELVASGTQNQWIYLPNGHEGLPGFRFEDKERTLSTMLLCEAETDEYCQYRLEATNVAGKTEMRSVEWVAAGNSSPLRNLYIMLWRAQQNVQKTGNKNADVDLEDDINLTNRFIDALLQDIQSKRNCIHFERSGAGFVASGFGRSESTITVTKEGEDSISGQFLVKVEKPDGTLILSCAETSKNSNSEAELRMLYRLLDDKIPMVTVDEGTVDVQMFVENRLFDNCYDNVIQQHAIPEMHKADTPLPEHAVLIYDIFESVSEPRVIQQFLDEVSIRKGPLSDQEYKRLKALAQGVFASIRHTRRCPNGCVFTTKAVPIAVENPSMASRDIRCASNLSHIANAYTLWGDLVGQNPAIGEARTMKKVAVLILMVVLADQLP